MMLESTGFIVAGIEVVAGMRLVATGVPLRQFFFGGQAAGVVDELLAFLEATQMLSRLAGACSSEVLPVMCFYLKVGPWDDVVIVADVREATAGAVLRIDPNGAWMRRP